MRVLVHDAACIDMVHSPLGTSSRTPSSLTRLTCDCGSAHTSSKPRTSRPPDRESVPPWRPPSLSSAPAARHCAHQHHRPWRRPAVLSTGIISNGSVPWCPCRVAGPAPRQAPGICTPVSRHTRRDRASEPIHDKECDALQTTRHNAHELVEGLGMVVHSVFEVAQCNTVDFGAILIGTCTHNVALTLLSAWCGSVHCTMETRGAGWD